MLTFVQNLVFVPLTRTIGLQFPMLTFRTRFARATGRRGVSISGFALNRNTSPLFCERSKQKSFKVRIADQ
jgi:uncharacterized membrane protein